MNSSGGNYLRILQVTYFGILAGILLSAIVAVYLTYSNLLAVRMDDARDLFRIVLVVAGLGGVIGSITMFKKRMTAIRANTDLKTKLAAYRMALVIKLFMIEGPTMLGIILFLLTRDYLILSITGLIIVFFIMNRPSKYSVMNDLELTGDEWAGY